MDSIIFKRSIVVQGVEYLLGSAGSFIIGCERCGAEHFREAHEYFAHPEWYNCFTCKPRQQMVPIRVDELETKWKPLWRSLGYAVKGDPCDKCGEPWSDEHDQSAHAGES
jgi:hypothetical protein